VVPRLFALQDSARLQQRAGVATEAAPGAAKLNFQRINMGSG